MWKHLLGICLYFSLGLGTAFGQWGANLSATSDYLFRGFSQTDEGPALQGGLDFSFSGWTVGAWASNVQFGDEKDLEYDLFASYAKEWANGVALDLGYVKYLYIDLETAEADDLSLGITYKNLGARLYKGFDVSWTYWELSYGVQLPKAWMLNFRGGNWDIKDGSESTDWQVSVEKSLTHFDVQVSYTDTDVSGDATADARVYLALSKAWSF